MRVVELAARFIRGEKGSLKGEETNTQIDENLPQQILFCQ